MKTFAKYISFCLATATLFSCATTTSKKKETNSTVEKISSISKVENIIDTHAHILMPGEELTLNPKVPGSPEELRRQMKEGGVAISGIMSMVAGNSFEKMKKHNDYILKLAKESPDFFPICSVHPLDGKAALDELTRVAKLGAKAVKVHPFYQGFDVAHSSVNDVVKLAGELGLVVLFDSVSPKDGGMVGKFVDVAIANPKTKIVLAHMGGTRFHEMLLFHVLSKGPWYNNNVYFDLSAVAELYNNSPRQKELIWTIRQIGIEQFLFASDFPIFNLKTTRDVVDEYNFSQDELQKLCHDNAKKLFKL